MMAVASTRTPGFVWDAQTSIWNVSTNVLQSCITHARGEQHETDDLPTVERKMVTKVGGKYPLWDLQDDDPSILVWLAMMPLFPVVVLPQPGATTGILHWNTHEEALELAPEEYDCASAQLRLDERDAATVGVEFVFSKPDGLLTHIRMAMAASEETWQATYSHYQERLVEVRRGEPPQTIRIPSTIEIGKTSGETEPYRAQFRIHNHRLHYHRR